MGEYDEGPRQGGGRGGGIRPVSQKSSFSPLFSEWRQDVEQRSHRVIGAEQQLFMRHPFAPGAPFFLPHGTRIVQRLQDYLRKEYRRRGFDEIMTPLMFDEHLWRTSGHWDHFAEDMFFVRV